ncbi:MAG: hypothetical protein ACXWP5_02775 [Bdellovibrionota bacterium]
MMFKKLSVVVCAFAFAMISGSQASAHEGHGGGACGADMKKFCGEVKKGDHEGMMKCMNDNESKFSDACKAQHTKMKGMMDEMKTACKSDRETFCKDVPEGDHHAMRECMMKNEKKLSKECQAAHKKMKSMMKGHHGHEGHAAE